MNKMKKSIGFIVLVSLVFSLFSCSFGGGDIQSGSVIVLSKKDIEFSEIGEEQLLTATIVPAPENSESVVWESSNSKVATCTDGLVKAVGYGNCVVRATCGGATTTCTVRVPNPYPALNLSKTSVVAYELNKETSVSAITFDREDVTANATWTTSNPNIAKVSGGKITALKYGICTITAYYNNAYATCVFEAKDNTKPTLSFADEKIILNAGEKFTLDARRSDSDGTKSVSYRVSDEKVAVIEDGCIKGVSTGVCVVTAYSDDGLYDYLIVNVGNYKYTDVSDYNIAFSFSNIGDEIKYVSRDTGEIISSVVVYDYDIKRYSVTFEGVVYVEFALKCAKVYDKDGINGKNTIAVVTNMYDEYGSLCETRSYKESANIEYGKKTSVQCLPTGMRVTTGECRSFYVSFSEAVEG